MNLYIAISDCQPFYSSFSANQNYILTSIPRISGFKNSGNGPNNADFANKGTCDLMQTIQYFDGLGRPSQTTQVKGSPLSADIVLPFTYDAYGREVQKFLPYAATTSDGSYKSDGLTTGPMNFYYPGGTALSGSQQSNGMVYNPKPYSITNFELSPLNRITEQGAPGPDWQPVSGNTTGHTLKLDYTTNNLNTFSGTDTSISRSVVIYNVLINGDQSRTLTFGNSAGSSYPANELSVTISKDENWKSGRGGTTEEYKDKNGRAILKRTFLFSGGALQQLSTYYVYDDRGNLCFVLPPASGADAGITTAGNLAALNNLCYQYQYDGRNRLTQKRLPGGQDQGWEYTVYNQLDQVVATQDGNQRLTNQWTFNKYDALGRTLWTGIWNNGGVAISRIDLQNLVTNFPGPLWENRPSGGYPSNNAWPTSGFQGSLTVNYYDDYTFGDFASLPYDYRSTASKNTRGLLTCTKTWVPGSTAVLYKMFYYDDFGRQMRTYSEHYLRGTTAVANPNNYNVSDYTYDFCSNLTATTLRHFTVASTTIPVVTISNTYLYDHVNRRTQTNETIYNGNNIPPDPIVVNKLDYNEIGQLKSKGLHKETGMPSFLQTVNYRYNERGWLQSAKTDGNLFNETIYYNQPTDNTFSKLYNGNISEVIYTKTGATDVVFKYSYDQLNRLTGGVSTGGSTLGEQLSYDLMGNIKTLVRTGSNPATLDYSYNNNNLSNQLQVVKNGGTVFRSYGYDANGNATSDGAGKTINYNVLNLPQTITQGATTLATYIYDATGQKLSNTGSDGRWDYIDGVVYNGTGTSDETIKFIQTEEGRATPNGTAWNYTYNLSDHLGNVRVSFDKNPVGGTARRVQEDEYYAFGLRRTPIVYDYSNNNRYLYNGKELQTDLAGQYDYGARFYDPVIARWTSVDPKAELSTKFNPYNYCFDNPVFFVDPDGMLATYDWGSKQYVDGGEKVDWDVVQKQYGIGDFSNNQSVMLAPGYESDGTTIQHDYNTGALTTMVNAAEKTGGNINILHVNNANDAANQMRKFGGRINNLFILSHGDSKNSFVDGEHHSAYFAIGSEVFHASDILRSKALSRIAASLSSNRDFLPSPADVILFACGVGGRYNDGANLLTVLANKLNATTFGNQSLSVASGVAFSGGAVCFSGSDWPSGHDFHGAFSNSYRNKGNWTMAIPKGITQDIHNVYFDNSARIHFTR